MKNYQANNEKLSSKYWKSDDNQILKKKQAKGTNNEANGEKLPNK